MNEHHLLDTRPVFIERGSAVRVRQRALFWTTEPLRAWKERLVELL
jgi:hypothetical protein